MPLIQSSYNAPFLFSNGHIQSIYPSLFRTIKDDFFKRERITTTDADFLDLDWNRDAKSEELLILSHGLEGNSRRSYILGMARYFMQRNYDILAWNYRSCSGEMNRTKRLYHSGATDDLDFVIQHALSTKSYKKISLVGFSMGGNLTLKYLGEEKFPTAKCIHAAVAISVPCDLRSSSIQLEQWQNKIYMRRFLRLLHQKLKAKEALFPDLYNTDNYQKITSFREFDDRYTSTLHAFKDAEDYWQKSSSKQFLSNITIPTLILNAKDDPFLAEECYPIELCRKHRHVFLEQPDSGGHVGFVQKKSDASYYSEQRAYDFITNHEAFLGAC